jgi:hypothetical protein
MLVHSIKCSGMMALVGMDGMEICHTKKVVNYSKSKLLQLFYFIWGASLNFKSLFKVFLKFKKPFYTKMSFKILKFFTST